ncbi:ribokinase [Clostridium sardiniense]|uniref:Ribokinase n=1 Tax=Clostridium sardiniense TaxID=29369 RepID=A0ABS7KWL3_CLOSR|nr:ribokinase [Clostridium sardiniense]MBM7834192.1 ribokinase [Clostridium sardiniense]MBY0754972.1 ribokinase [Clostridium sardiniense]MDQ0459174.1 ribokinase [Clostridium sardiniense]
MNKVCVLGSINMDLVIKVNEMPKEGETILSKSFEKIAGGKGANQAVAAKRCGNIVSMIGKIGRDDNGQILKTLLDEEGIDTSLVFEDKNEPTGMAMITVNNRGNNSITVISGSNMTLNKSEIDKSKEVIKNSDILISQFETPEEITLEAFKIAKENNKITILNPAPAKKIDDELLKYTDIIIPNETEAELLTGVEVNDLETAKIASKELLDKGVKFVIITLGSKGAAVINKENGQVVPAFKVNAVDTTAAGDSFIGGLSSKLNIENLNFENLLKAVKFGNKVSSITVQREGAQPSIARLVEVIEIYGEE